MCEDDRGGLSFERARAGDGRALESVLRRLGPTVLGAARRVLGSRLHAEAEDVAQDSLMAIARALPKIKDEAALPAYAVRTTIRNAIRVRKRKQREVSVDPAIEPPGETLSPEHDAARRQQAEVLLSLLDELPGRQAEALFLRVVLDQSLDEVARTLDIPINTVRSRVRLARNALRKKITKRPELRALWEARR